MEWGRWGAESSVMPMEERLFQDRLTWRARRPPRRCQLMSRWTSAASPHARQPVPAVARNRAAWLSEQRLDSHHARERPCGAHRSPPRRQRAGGARRADSAPQRRTAGPRARRGAIRDKLLRHTARRHRSGSRMWHAVPQALQQGTRRRPAGRATEAAARTRARESSLAPAPLIAITCALSQETGASPGREPHSRAPARNESQPQGGFADAVLRPLGAPGVAVAGGSIAGDQIYDPAPLAEELLSVFGDLLLRGEQAME